MSISATKHRPTNKSNTMMIKTGFKVTLLLLAALLAACSNDTPPPAQVDEPAAAPSALQQEWGEYMAPFTNMAEELAPLLNNVEDEQERHELYEFILSQMASGYAMLFYADPANPDWWPLFSHVFDALWANPDTVYYYAPAEPTGSYKLSGTRGEVRVVDIQLGGGQFVTEGTTVGGMGVVQGNYDLDKLDIAEDGSFEIIVSPEKPEGYTGNWLQMTPDTTYFLIRQVRYDWNEKEVNIAIERLDTPARGTRRTVEELRADLKQLATWTKNWVAVSYNIAKRDRAQGAPDKFNLVDWMESGFGDQKYVVNSFDIADDEAIIIESEIPEVCRYWGFQIVTEQWRAVNPLKHQSNLNPHIAHIDSDGIFRAVIANKDPGVPNWLDPGGFNQSRVYARWNKCSSTPMPTAKTVKLADVRQYLPQNTPVVTAEQREVSLRARSKAAQMRRRW